VSVQIGFDFGYRFIHGGGSGDLEIASVRLQTMALKRVGFFQPQADIDLFAGWVAALSGPFGGLFNAFNFLFFRAGQSSSHDDGNEFKIANLDSVSIF
jgi:hypothetical protein